jgi:hypothetical protein
VVKNCCLRQVYQKNSLVVQAFTAQPAIKFIVAYTASKRFIGSRYCFVCKILVRITAFYKILKCHMQDVDMTAPQQFLICQSEDGPTRIVVMLDVLAAVSGGGK